MFVMLLILRKSKKGQMSSYCAWGIFEEFHSVFFYFSSVLQKLLERLRNENKDKMKTQMTQSFNEYSENETKIWRQNILNQFNHVFSSCLRSHFVISLLLVIVLQIVLQNDFLASG